MVWAKMAWLAGAGALGTLARYGTAFLAQRVLGTTFPWGTLAVNLLGCFAFGVIWLLAEERLVISPQSRTVVLVGFMGAYTTFSTFAFETVQMLQARQWGAAAANFAAQNLFGLVAVFAGMMIGSWLSGAR